VALAATRSGGTVVLAGIEMSDIPSMSYDASLFRECGLRTVTTLDPRDLLPHLRHPEAQIWSDRETGG